jgi:hypothetical protein
MRTAPSTVVLALISCAACKPATSSQTQSQGSNKTGATHEECGTLMVSQGKLMFETVGNNSDKNVQIEVEGKDQATATKLQKLAESLAGACISADFSVKGTVMVSSPESIR